MVIGRVQVADHHDHHVFAPPHVIIPSGEESGIPEPHAPSDLVRGGQGLDNLFPMLRQQIGMSFGNMMLPFPGQLDFAVQVWARKPTCHGLLQATCKRQS